MAKDCLHRLIRLIVVTNLLIILLFGCDLSNDKTDDSADSSDVTSKLKDDCAVSESESAILQTSANNDFLGDILGIIIYDGRVYKQSDLIYCDEDEKQCFCGAFIGSALANIPSSCSGSHMNLSDILKSYPDDLSSNITGDIYSVEGYETTEYLCIPELYDGCDFIVFYKNEN